jgi:hypothetical protein
VFRVYPYSGNNSASSLNLRPYIADRKKTTVILKHMFNLDEMFADPNFRTELEAGAYTRPLFSST